MPRFVSGGGPKPAAPLSEPLAIEPTLDESIWSALDVPDDPAPLPAGESHLGEVGGNAVTISASFARPADTTAYASGDLVANSTTAGLVEPLAFPEAVRVRGGSALLRRVRLAKNSTGVTASSFRVHFYTRRPTAANGDNSAWSTNGALHYLGNVDVTIDKAFTDGAQGIGSPAAGSEITFVPVETTIWALVEARGAYTPVSQEIVTVTLELLRN